MNEEINQYQQLEREFDIHEFELVVMQLVESMQINTKTSIREYYNEVKTINGRVIGKDILEVVKMMKEQIKNEKEISEEVEFYKNTISEMEKKNKNIFTISEFFITFVLNNPNRGTLTEQIQNKLTEAKEISMDKLKQILNCSQLPIRATTDTKILSRTELNEDYTLDSITPSYELEELISLHALINVHIKGENIKEETFRLLELINESMVENSKTLNRMYELEEMLKNSEEKYDSECFKYEKIIQEKETIINRLYSNNEKYEEHINAFEEKCEGEYKKTIDYLQEQILNLNTDNYKLTAKCNQLLFDVEWFKENLENMTNQYEEATEEIHHIEEKEEKLNACHENYELLAKSQAKSNLAIIAKLQNENQDLRNRVSDLEIELESKRIISPNHTERTSKPLILGESLSFSFSHKEVKEILLKNLRKGSLSQDCSKLIKVDDSVISVSSAKSNEFNIIPELSKEHLENDSKVFNSSENEMGSIFSKKLHEFDFAGILDRPVLREITSLIEQFNKNNRVIKPIFTCHIRIVKSNGSQTEMQIAICCKKIIFISNPHKIVLSIPIADITDILFCERNRNWIVLKLKENNHKIGKERIVDMVLRIPYRLEFLRYFLGFVYSESRIKISLEKEENVSVTENGNLIPLCYFKSFSNTVELSLCDGENTFEAHIKEPGLFKFFSSIFLVITSVGVIALERTKKEWDKVEEQVRLKHFLPFSSFMEVIDLSCEKKLKVTYSNERSYILEFESYATAKYAQSQILRVKKETNEKSRNLIEKQLPVYESVIKRKENEEPPFLMF